MLIKRFPDIENIRMVAIPLPDFSDLITANLYAVGKGPVTLIDTGPKMPGSLEFIRKQLRPTRRPRLPEFKGIYGLT